MSMKPTANDTHRFNEFGQPIGFEVPDWKSPPFPLHEPKIGRYVRLEPLNAEKHAHDHYDAQQDDKTGERWTYGFHGPYFDFGSFEQWAREAQASRDPQFYAIVDAATGRAAGSAAWMRIDPKHGVI